MGYMPIGLKAFKYLIESVFRGINPLNRLAKLYLNGTRHRYEGAQILHIEDEVSDMI